MSVRIKVLHEQDAEGKEYGEPAFHDSPLVAEIGGSIGYVIAALSKHADGSITLEREIAVHADNAEDNDLAEHVVKDIQAKLEEIFPDPNKPQPSKLWVPN